MTDFQIYECLLRIDNGEIPSDNIRKMLASVERLRWIDIDFLPTRRSIHLLLNIKTLNLSGNNRFSSISTLSYLKSLSNLDLSHTYIGNISPLCSLTELKVLNLSWNRKLVDIGALSKLKKLERLDLHCTKVSNIDVLYSLTSIKELNLNCTNIHCSKVTNINALSFLSDLLSLDLSINKQLSDISALAGLTKVERLDLHETGIKDIDVLSKLDSIKYLDLSGTDVVDISALSFLNRLEYLDLSNTGVTDINALSNLKMLKYLNVSKNKGLSNISSVSNLTELRNLDINGTEVHDISVLSNLRKLKNIDLRNLYINAIPKDLVDLNIPFLMDETVATSGIHISGITLTEQPIEIFTQTHDLIRAYYSELEQVPVNECKVIFLGDAEAGKTHTIKRLLKKPQSQILWDSGLRT